MQVTEISSDGLKHEFNVVIDAKEIGDKMDAKLEALKNQVRLPGFRPGKVPLNLLRKRYGSSVMGEVLEETVNASAQQTISDRQLRPAGQPNIEITKFAEGDNLEFKLSLEVMPEIEATDFSRLELQRLKVEVTDKDISDVLQRLADQQKTFVAVAKNRKSKLGDALQIDFVGKVDGEAFDGGAGTDFQLELGSGTFIPGFEDQLIGTKGGDQVDVKVVFPAEYGAKELAGKEAIFDVSVKEVREPQMAAIDDDLAVKIGLDNLQALKDAAKGQLQQENDNLSRARLKRSLLDALEAAHEFEVPPGMLESELSSIWEQVEAQRKSGGNDDEDAGKSDEELKAEYRLIAKRRVRLGLLLSDVGQKNNIQVQDEEVKRALVDRARAFPGQERQVFEYYQNNPEAMNQLRAPVYEDKVVDFILEMAKVSERVVTRDELMNEPDEDESSEEAKPKAKAARKKKTPAKK